MKRQHHLLIACTSIAVLVGGGDDSARLKKIEGSAKGRLQPLLRASQWSGRRLRVTGMDGEFMITEGIGDWRINLVPDKFENLVEIKGLLFAKDFPVLLNMDTNMLIIDGVDFAGRPMSGQSPMFKGMHFEGVTYERMLGKVFGIASIIVLDDGRICMDFDKIYVGTSRAREYGELLPVGR